MQLYLILKADGTPRHNKRSRNLCLYDTCGKAKNNARADGDCVVAVDVDLKREPLFIRRKVMSVAS